MKNMIITLAIILLLSNLLMFQKDTNALVWTMNNMKFVADEMARSAALEVDEEKYSIGDFEFEEKSGKEAAEKAFEQGIESVEKRASIVLFDKEKVNYTVEFDNENKQVKVKMNLGQAKFGLFYLRNPQEMKCQSIYEYCLPT